MTAAFIKLGLLLAQWAVITTVIAIGMAAFGRGRQ